jgi:hypothetical protein
METCSRRGMNLNRARSALNYRETRFVVDGNASSRHNEHCHFPIEEVSTAELGLAPTQHQHSALPPHSSGWKRTPLATHLQAMSSCRSRNREYGDVSCGVFAMALVCLTTCSTSSISLNLVGQTVNWGLGLGLRVVVRGVYVCL